MEVRLRMDLRTWAAQHGMDLVELGQQAGLSRTAIEYLADGKRHPGKKSIAGLMVATGLTFTDLFEATDVR